MLLHNSLFLRFEDEWLRAGMNYSRKVAIKKLPESLKNAVEKKIFGGKNQDKKLRKTLKSSGPSKLTWFINVHIKLVESFTNKHFESSQKLLKSSFVNERFKNYSMLPNELLTFETTNFKNLKYYWKLYCVHLCCKLVLSIPIL